MSKNKKPERIKREARRRAWVSFRYLFPVLMIVLMLISMAIPCLRYTTADTGTNETISTFQLIENSWGQVRVYLFGTGEQTAENIAFSWTVLICLAVFVILFALGTAIAVWSAIGALRYLRNPEEKGMARTVFLTVLPNRFAVCAWQALLLLLPAFPRVLVLIYKKILMYSVILNVTFADPILICGILYGISIILAAVFQPLEYAWGMNPFRWREESSRIEDDEVRTEETPVFTNEAERKYYEMNQQAREEQAERIRQLLLGDEEKRDEDEKKDG